VEAEQEVGIDMAVPKAIMMHINVEHLMRENVASYLQKYRDVVKREEEQAKRELAEADAAVPQLAAANAAAIATVAASRSRSRYRSKGAGKKGESSGYGDTEDGFDVQEKSSSYVDLSTVTNKKHVSRYCGAAGTREGDDEKAG
jgi:SHAQKYF class myb-like DNA-binding protein